MTDMKASEIRSRFLAFFKERGHAVIPSASLIPENDPSVLFNTAGMQPLVPYLLGEPHPLGKRLANSQKCVRTVDIDEIGDKTHATFFEMLGNWSLGDYFKEDAIRWSFEFLTSSEKGLGLDPRRLYVTVFEGDENAPRDEESAAIWQKIFEENGIAGERIYFLGADSNWWSPGENGPCGPDTEMFYDVTGKLTEGMTQEEYLAADEKQDVVEIWNDVFMEYEKKDGKIVGKLANKNVDTGSGLERVAMVVQGKDNIFDTDIFSEVIERIRTIRKEYRGDLTNSIIGDNIEQKSIDLKEERILADHLRTTFFLISDGVRPSNKDQGYVLRRLMRRTMFLEYGMGERLIEIFEIYENQYKDIYDNVSASLAKSVYLEELKKFEKNAQKGLSEIIKKYVNIQGHIPQGHVSGKDAFYFFSTFGIPKEMFLDTLDESLKKGVWLLDESFSVDYEEEFKKHQELSRTASAGKFKGGLADHSDKVTAFHTATHLMLAALRKELGDDVHQAGSNITEERTRFDFTYPEKVSREVLDRVETYVNDAIVAGAPVATTIMAKDAAREAGVEGSFWEKYPEQVTVYQVEGEDGALYSRELCGGPHVANTAEIAKFGRFRIAKEESSSAGVRRIKAVFDPSV